MSEGNNKRAASPSSNDVKRVKLEGDSAAAVTTTTTSDAIEPSSPTRNSNSDNRRDNKNDGRRGRAGNNQGKRGGRGGGSNNNSRGGGGGGRGKGKGRENKGGTWQDDDGRKSKNHRNDNEEDEGNGLNTDGTPKLPKKKVALLIGYSGLGYSGSQINPGVKTIEQEVFDACVKAGAISQDNSDNVNKVSLMRAARTDAGVSAAINVLNLKLILTPPSLPSGQSLVEFINTFLPPAVRLWNIIRVQGGFHSRTMCDSRMYNYSLPTYCFLEPRPETNMGKRITKATSGSGSGRGEEGNWWDDKPAVVTKEERANKEQEEGVSEQAPPMRPAVQAEETASEDPVTAAAAAPVQGESNPTDDATSAAPPPLSAFKEDQLLRKGYRITPEVLQRLRNTIEAYRGSHNFWNFTVGKDFGDRSCQRVMKNLTVTDPFMVGDAEWVSLKFHGQSFMLHQIRKMVGLLIMAVRTRTPPALIPETFGPARLNIPKAPALGLLLEQPQFESYNRKILAQNEQISSRASSKPKPSATAEEGSSTVQSASKDAGEGEDEASQLRDPVDYASVDEQVEKFKKETVFKNMHEEEERDDTYAKWLNLHDNQLGNDFDYLNSKGVIPSSAIISTKKKAPATTPKDSNDASVTPKAGKPSIDPEEDEDEETRLAKLNSGKGSADMEG